MMPMRGLAVMRVGAGRVGASRDENGAEDESQSW